MGKTDAAVETAKKILAIATVKEIHNDFNKQAFSGMVTESQTRSLKKTGFELIPPVEYAHLFPFHKIIHLNKILLLCQKHGLFFSQTNNFSGNIPPKNLAELDQFVNQYNYVHLRKHERESILDAFRFGPIKEKNKEKNFLFVKEKDKEKTPHDYQESIYAWHIVAPGDMILTNKARKRYGDDPIIIGMIRPSIGCGSVGGFGDKIRWGVIVTAWGDEAADEMIVNENMN